MPGDQLPARVQGYAAVIKQCVAPALPGPVRIEHVDVVDEWSTDDETAARIAEGLRERVA